jgi:glycine oxidase
MIVIIGAGICGLGIGWQLAKAGRQVAVVERGEAGRATSWAAAGMLAPQVEAEPSEEALLPLLLESRALWAEFAAELAEDGGMAVDYRTEGTLVVALDRDDQARLDFLATYYREQRLEVEVLTGREILRREPYLSRRVVGGLFSPLDHQVDNRKVVEAMKRAFRAGRGRGRRRWPDHGRGGGPGDRSLGARACRLAGRSPPPGAPGQGSDGGGADERRGAAVAPRGLDTRWLSRPAARRALADRRHRRGCRL